MLEHHAKAISKQLRKFSDRYAVVDGHPERLRGANFVAFEFDVASDEVYQALEEQCRAWLDDPDSMVVSYTLSPSPPDTCKPAHTSSLAPEAQMPTDCGKKTIPELWSILKESLEDSAKAVRSVDYGLNHQEHSTDNV